MKELNFNGSLCDCVFINVIYRSIDDGVFEHPDPTTTDNSFPEGKCVISSGGFSSLKLGAITVGNKLFKGLTILLFSALLLTFIISVCGIDIVEAASKGVNIIKQEDSATSLPLNTEEINELQKKYINATTEIEKEKLMAQLEEIGKSMQIWYEENADLEKEEKVREKQKLLVNTLLEEETEIGRKKQREMLPYTVIGYDYVSHSLKVSIDPEMFNEKNIKKYIKKIRSIIGDEIDLTISPMPYAKKG